MNPSLPIDCAVYLSRYQLLTASEFGVLMRLFMAQWQHGTLPDDPKRLERVIGPELAEHWPQLGQYFRPHASGGIANDYVRGQWEEEQRKQAQRTAAGRKRWGIASGYATERAIGYAGEGSDGITVLLPVEGAPEDAPANAPDPSPDAGKKVSPAPLQRNTHSRVGENISSSRERAGKGAGETDAAEKDLQRRIGEFADMVTKWNEKMHEGNADQVIAFVAHYTQAVDGGKFLAETRNPFEIGKMFTKWCAQDRQRNGARSAETPMPRTRKAKHTR